LLTISFILPHISAITKVSISSTTPIFVLIISIYFNKNKKITYLENLSKQELNKKLILFLLIGLGTYLVIN
jgi:drug/metabolite transporter (DMT)-like permease